MEEVITKFKIGQYTCMQLALKAQPEKQVKFLHLGSENVEIFLRQKSKPVR